MGQKKKVGKARRDKAYWSAKEIGYRSRASFKLIQLNRKFEFLQKSRVCIDLCAAPGSWMQVAKEHMPMSSLIIGVDLAPIKPIPGCINLLEDITTDKCRSALKKELQTWKADLVLNDGAPNVGKSWVHDAYQQSLLTLAAFKLATEHLMKNGTFVTKIFRSKDYQSLIWVFNQFFKRVNATKPAASRHESAEIFVVCLGYKAPDKIDPKFLDPKHVFSDVESSIDADSAAVDNELINPERKKKAPAEGYESGTTLLFKVTKASDFIMGDKPIHVLNNCHEITLDEDRIRKHKKTTTEVVECCKDIKVLGMKELRLLKKWREVLRSEFETLAKKTITNEATNTVQTESEKENDSDLSEDEDLKKLEDEIYTLKDEERRGDRRAKKKALKEKRKAAERIDLKMVIPGDQGPTLQESGLFKLSDIKSTQDMNSVVEQTPDTLEHDSDEESSVKKPKKEKYSKENGKLDKSGLFYKQEDDTDNETEDSEASDDGEDLGLGDELESDEDIDDEEIDRLNDPSKNELIVDMEETNRVSRKEKRANMWFDKDVFKGIEDDEDLEEADVEMAISEIKKQGGKINQKEDKKEKSTKKEKKQKNDIERLNKVKKAGISNPEKVENSDGSESSSSESDSDDSDFDENEHYPYKKQKKVEAEGFEEVPAGANIKNKKRPMLSPEELALGQELISSKKRRRELEDAAWNRYMFDDKDKDLPDWFLQEEQYHMRKIPEVDPQAVEYYKNKQKDVNVKTIKKVVEAKARKKRLLMKKMSKAKKKAANIMENEDLGSREKGKEIARLYKRAASTKKREVVYSVAKKFVAAKKAKRPSGVKGQFKQVDPRMKKDTFAKRGNATSKRVQKRNLKGKKTKPQR